MIEDAVNAARAALQEGVVPGGGVALLQISPALVDAAEHLAGDARQGALLLQAALAQPLAAIAGNCGLDAATVLSRVAGAPRGSGLDARSGAYVDMAAAGVIDPVKVTISAVRNAASVAALILTTQTLIAKKPEYSDPTAGPALGGGAELLGRA
jgi:chaperonin GroEL